MAAMMRILNQINPFFLCSQLSTGSPVTPRRNLYRWEIEITRIEFQLDGIPTRRDSHKTEFPLDGIPTRCGC